MFVDLWERPEIFNSHISRFLYIYYQICWAVEAYPLAGHRAPRRKEGRYRQGDKRVVCGEDGASCLTNYRILDGGAAWESLVERGCHFSLFLGLWEAG